MRAAAAGLLLTVCAQGAEIACYGRLDSGARQRADRPPPGSMTVARSAASRARPSARSKGETGPIRAGNEEAKAETGRARTSAL